MSEHTNYCTGKGLFVSLLVIVFLLVGVPVLSTYAIVGHDAYANYCNMAIHLPCFGIGN